MPERISFQNSKGKMLYGKYSHSKKPLDFAVVLCHGYGSSMNDPGLIAMEKALAGNGIASLRFSFLGQKFLRPDPELISASECLDDARNAYAYLKKRHANVGFFGISMGGLASILAASRLKRVWALGLVCPALNNLGEILAYIYGIDMKEWKKKGYAKAGLFKRMPYSIYLDAKKYDLNKSAKQIGCKIKLIIGTKDQLIPLHYAQAFVKSAKDCDYEFIEGEGHDFSKGHLVYVFKSMLEYFKSQKEQDSILIMNPRKKVC